MLTDTNGEMEITCTLMIVAVVAVVVMFEANEIDFRGYVKQCE